MSSLIEAGRNDLAAWIDAQPRNFYRADAPFRRIVRRLLGAESAELLEPRLDALGAACATELDVAAEVNNRPLNLPRLERFDAIGRRTEEIEHHPSYHVAGRVIYESGMLSEYARPAPFVRSLALFELTSMCGEAGHNCPVACTAGVIRTLQALGSPEQKQAFLPRLLLPVYPDRLDGAQFLTEVQGGSDVGQNSTIAHLHDDGTWRIRGEKWFCSNAGAALFLLTARHEAGSSGTSGLGLFLVARRLPDGSTNHFSLRRLKEKLGTRSMASGEIDFSDAIALPLGPPNDGFRNMMRYVINTSRLYNAVATTGILRRAVFVARGYADHRRAFGRPIADFPLVQENLARIESDGIASLASTFDIARSFDALESGRASPDGEILARTLVNLNKRRSSISATEAALRGIEVLGGNGAIESFSVLPRLLRDAVVCENWEGTHNTLTAQTLRDMHRYRAHAVVLDALSQRLASAATGTAEDFAAPGKALIDRLRRECDRVLSLGEDEASLSMRPLMDRLSYLHQVVALLEQATDDAAHARDSFLLDAARYFWNWRLDGIAPPLDVEPLRLLATVARGCPHGD